LESTTRFTTDLRTAVQQWGLIRDLRSGRFDVAVGVWDGTAGYDLLTGGGLVGYLIVFLWEADTALKNFIAFAALGALGNIILDILLIPTLGIVGCALATVITQLIANSFMWRKLKAVSDYKIF